MLEQELKFTVADRSVLDAVLASSHVQGLVIGDADPPAESFRGVYYDTPDLALQDKQCSLRARREGNRFRAALKMPGTIVDGLSVREEFEIDIRDWPTAVADLPDATFRSRVAAIIPAGSWLMPRIEVDMLRRVVHLAAGESRIELVLDEGEIHGGGRSVSLCEVELELIRGEVADVLALGEILENRFPLILSTLSKHEIGLQLCEGADAAG
ncbi:MAG: CYTH domain-containing protein [Gammaproteobacteria bacterium]|nr:CYTH domain-containing protein [Gammaproteobacteria bacterium]